MTQKRIAPPCVSPCKTLNRIGALPDRKGERRRDETTDDVMAEWIRYPSGLHGRRTLMQNTTSSALSNVRAGEGIVGCTSGTDQRTASVRALALEIAEKTLSPDGVPDAEDWEMAELLFS
jgi:hypothetical protein